MDGLKIEMVPSWITSDGQRFYNEREARLHELQPKLIEFLADSLIWGENMQPEEALPQIAGRIINSWDDLKTLMGEPA